jgi:hypothetical protein
MSTVNNGPQIVRSGLVLNLDAGNGKSYSTNRFQALGSGTVAENVTFPIQGTGTFQRVASGTVVGGYTVRPNDVVYSYALGVTGCHYHGNTAPIPSGVYLTFSCDYLVTGATTYPINNTLLVIENYGGGALSASIGGPNSLQNIWQRVTFTAGPTSAAGSQAMFLYPGYCAPGRLADSGTVYFRNPKVEWTNVDTGNSTFNSTSNIGLWYDLSGNRNNGTLAGANGIPASSYANKGSLLFDGVDDSVLITNNATLRPSTELTIEYVIKGSTPAGWNPIIGYGNGDYTNGNYLCWVETGGALNSLCRINNSGTVTEYRQYSGIGISSTALKCMSFTMRIGDSIRSYYNGVDTNTPTVLPSGGSFYYGGTTSAYQISGAGGAWLNGNIYYMRLYNRALTATEVMQNYEATKTRFGL